MYHRMTPDDLVAGLNLRKAAMRAERIFRIRIAARGDSLDTWQVAILRSLVESVFQDCPSEIYICTGEIETPAPEERLGIVKKWYEGTTGGHKGVTKTYQRLRQRYCWPGMRNEVQDVIRCCASCQTQKVTRIKTREPMIIPDIPVEA